MAKGSMLMGTQYGKLGESVLYRAGGSQRQRAYVPVVSNPKTALQMAQRTKMANLIAFYRNAQVLLKDSFTNRPVKQSGYNAFVAANLGLVDVFLSKEQVAAGACVVANYLISAGTLQPIQTYGAGISTRTNIALGDLVIGSATTIGEVSAAILANNQMFQAGDEITYLSFVQTTNANTGAPVVAFSYYSFVLNTADAQVFRDFMPEVAASVSDGYLAHGSNIGSGAFAWLYSRKKADGSLNCSRQTLILTSADVNAAYISDNAKQAAAVSYNVQLSPIIAPDGGSVPAGGGGEVPVVTTPSVSAVSVKGTALSTSVDEFAITAADTIVITGSNLPETGIGIRINGAQAITPTLTGSANSKSGALTGATGGTLSTLQIVIGGNVVYSVTLKSDMQL